MFYLVMKLGKIYLDITKGWGGDFKNSPSKKVKEHQSNLKLADVTSANLFILFSITATNIRQFPESRDALIQKSHSTLISVSFIT